MRFSLIVIWLVYVFKQSGQEWLKKYTELNQRFYFPITCSMVIRTLEVREDWPAS